MAPHISIVLGEIANAVSEGRSPVPLPDAWRALGAAADALRAAGTPVDASLAHVRAACRLAAVPAVGEPEATGRRRQRVLVVPAVRNALSTVAANILFRSATFRHALRLAVALAFATAVYRVTELPRGYWFPMTTLFVLKPEFHETFVTGITRTLGTLLGAGLAALLVGILGSHPAVLTGLLLAFVWAGYTLFRATYTLFTVCITGYVVLLLSLATVPGPATAGYRALNTLLGGALALAIYRAWPTWEVQRLGDVLAAQADAGARYLEVIFGAYADPATWSPKLLQSARAEARRARSNSEAAIERALREPAVPDYLDADRSLGLLAAFRRYALGALALHAGLDERPTRPMPELAPLREEVTAAFRILGASLREERSPGELPPMRATYVALQSRLDPLVSEPIDVLVDSVTTMASILAPREV